jgi:integrase
MSDAALKTVRIRELNDQLRRDHTGGRTVITPGIQALGPEGVRSVLAAVASFDEFTEDNDPWGERDCAVLTVNGRRIIFKHDYYDRDLQFHSPDASDPAVTERVLTIMLSEEYRAPAMAGKQAKILTRQQVLAALHRARRGRYPQRDRVMVLLSVKAGLRAGEIAKLRWSMLLDADGRLSHRIDLHDSAAKKGSGRAIPLHPELRRALLLLRRRGGSEGAVIHSGRIARHAAEQHRELVSPAVPRPRPGRVLFPLGATDLHNLCGSPGLQGRG